MQKDTHITQVATPDEERELRFPVREEQPTLRNFTPVQLVILFIQFCLVGVFLGAILSNEPEHKDTTPPQKYVVVTLEREKKAGGGFKYRLVSTKHGGLEAIILENLPTVEQPGAYDDAKIKEQATPIHDVWMTTIDPPLKFATERQKFSAPPQLSISKDASMPLPPVPPPWSSQQPVVTSMAAILSSKQPRKVSATTRASQKARNDFYRG